MSGRIENALEDLRDIIVERVGDDVDRHVALLGVDLIKLHIEYLEAKLKEKNNG